jgi:hypothetical protein
MKTKQTELLAFVGGLVFFTVLAGIVISRDGRIRREVENQARSLLRISRDALEQAQAVMGTVKQTTRNLK